MPLSRSLAWLKLIKFSIWETVLFFYRGGSRLEILQLRINFYPGLASNYLKIVSMLRWISSLILHIYSILNIYSQIICASQQQFHFHQQSQFPPSNTPWLTGGCSPGQHSIMSKVIWFRFLWYNHTLRPRSRGVAGR